MPDMRHALGAVILRPPGSALPEDGLRDTLPEITALLAALLC